MFARFSALIENEPEYPHRVAYYFGGASANWVIWQISSIEQYVTERKADHLTYCSQAQGRYTVPCRRSWPGPTHRGFSLVGEWRHFWRDGSLAPRLADCLTIFLTIGAQRPNLRTIRLHSSEAFVAAGTRS
jgi:hypothetical protein